MATGLAIAVWVLYRATAPAQVNLDGLGYLKLLRHNFSAGHLLYMPLLRAAVALCRGNALNGGRLLSATCAAAAVALAYATARALIDRPAALLAAAGLALSYGAWVQGSDVECYAVALLAMMVLWATLLAWRSAPSLEATLAVALALAWAVLTHLTHVLLAPLVAAWLMAHAGSRRRGLAATAAALGTAFALAAACYAYAGFVVRDVDGPGLVRWVGTAQHGFAYSGSLLSRAADATYGLSRALVFSPDLSESDAQTLLGHFLLGLAVLATLAMLVVAGARGTPPGGLPPWVLAAWALPYAAMALAFFGSDHERWLFVLPPLWLAAAAALGPGRRARASLALLVAALGAINYGSAIAPATHWTWDQTRADAATEVMRDGDLAIFPGHSWDEYVGFHSGRRVVPLPVAYYAGVLGRAGCQRRIDHDVRGAWRRGSRVFVLRFFDPPATPAAPARPADERGFYELAQLGLDRAALQSLFDGFTHSPVATSQPSVTVHRLDPRSAGDDPAGLPAAGQSDNRSR